MTFNPQPSNEAAAHCRPNDDRDAELHQESQREIELAQIKPVPFLEGITVRDLANVLVVGTFRNGFIETLHAGDDSEFLSDSTLSRITNLEMKKLNIETSARLAHLLSLFFEHSRNLRRGFLNCSNTCETGSDTPCI